jgi:hypothetical protein
LGSTYVYHPQADSETEWQRQTVVHWLPAVEFAYNNDVYASTGLTPFYAEKAHYFGPSGCIMERPVDGSVHDGPDARPRAQKILEIRAILATATLWKYADRLTMPAEFAMGDCSGL